MRRYGLFAVTSEGVRALEPIEIIECESDAEAIAQASRRLGRRRDLDAIEVWVGDRKLLRVGGGEGDASISLRFLGRQDKGWAR